MILWRAWIKIVLELRPAFSRMRIFQWFMVALAAFSVSDEHNGVSSFIRALHINSDKYYDRLLDFFHSSGIDIVKLRKLWTRCIFKYLPVVRINGRIIMPADGLKVPKAGQRMPAVKVMHQESGNNNKPEFIRGHSCQTMGILCGSLDKTVFSVPIASEIHEGFSLDSNDKTTLLDKMNDLYKSLEIDENVYLTVDAYYNSRKFIAQINSKTHIISRARSNAVAYKKYQYSQNAKKGRGRFKVYGNKIKLSDIFKNENLFSSFKSPFPEDNGLVLKIYSENLLLRICGGLLCKFVWVVHPTKGSIILFSTDIEITAEEIFTAYALRFKIEISYKQAIHSVGVYSYHFWSKSFRYNKNQQETNLSKLSENDKKSFERKMQAFRIFTQTGIIAQGLMQYLSCAYPLEIWNNFQSWMRTKKENCFPSEWVTRIALKHSLPEFLADSNENGIFKKFILSIISFNFKELLKKCLA